MEGAVLAKQNQPDRYHSYQQLPKTENQHRNNKTEVKWAAKHLELLLWKKELLLWKKKSKTCNELKKESIGIGSRTCGNSSKYPSMGKGVVFHSSRSFARRMQVYITTMNSSGLLKEVKGSRLN